MAITSGTTTVTNSNRVVAAAVGDADVVEVVGVDEAGKTTASASGRLRNPMNG